MYVWLVILACTDSFSTVYSLCVPVFVTKARGKEWTTAADSHRQSSLKSSFPTVSRPLVIISHTHTYHLCKCEFSWRSIMYQTQLNHFWMASRDQMDCSFLQKLWNYSQNKKIYLHDLCCITQFEWKVCFNFLFFILYEPRFCRVFQKVSMLKKKSLLT